MKLTLITLILLAIGIWLGIAVHNDSGYVLIAYHNWSIEASIWVALSALIITFIVVFFLIRLIANTAGLSKRFRLWGSENRLRKAQKQTQQGLCALTEGRWKKSLDILTKAAKDYPTPLINYLASARAAQELHNYEQRDAILKQAALSTKGTELAIGLTQAQLQMAAKQWEMALATLRHMNHLQPRHLYTLKLLHIVYLQLDDWKSLIDLLPTLKKLKVLSNKKYAVLEKKVCLAQIENTDPKSVDTLWKQLPKTVKNDPDIITQYCKCLMANDNMQSAYKLLQQNLKIAWQDQLVNCLTQIQLEDLHPVLVFCENALKQQPHDEQLLYCLGSLCEKMQLWGKAEDYLQNSIKIKAMVGPYLALGRVKEQLGEANAALEAYRQGLTLAEQLQNINVFS